MSSEALAGNISKDLTVQDIAQAVAIINNAFDGCRYLVDFYPCAKTCANLQQNCSSLNKPLVAMSSGSLNKIKTLKVTAYPNPYTDQVKFNIQSPVPGNGKMDIYNMLGQKVETIYLGYLFAGKNRIIEYKIPLKSRGNLLYILKVSDQQVSGKLLGISLK